MIQNWSRTTKCPKYACSYCWIKYLLFFFSSFFLSFFLFKMEPLLCRVSSCYTQSEGRLRVPRWRETPLEGHIKCCSPRFCTHQVSSHLSDLPAAHSSPLGLLPPHLPDALFSCIQCLGIFPFHFSSVLLTAIIALFFLCVSSPLFLPHLSGKKIVPGINFLPLKTAQRRDAGHHVAIACGSLISAPL